VGAISDVFDHIDCSKLYEHESNERLFKLAEKRLAKAVSWHGATTDGDVHSRKEVHAAISTCRALLSVIDCRILVEIDNI
jgi:hypothetical protein